MSFKRICERCGEEWVHEHWCEGVKMVFVNQNEMGVIACGDDGFVYRLRNDCPATQMKLKWERIDCLMPKRKTVTE